MPQPEKGANGKQHHLNTTNFDQVIKKLKEELNIAYKALAQRDVEVNRLKKSKKIQSFN